MKQRANQFITNQPGFSLVELSIVLVILGLLVGGVLSGQSLIRASELRKIIRTQDSYRTAIMSFRDKYFALPSDMTNATAFWGTKTATSCINNAGAPLDLVNGTCDGNGDGFIFDGNGGNDENLRVWEQLSRAALIEGGYRYSSTGVTGRGISYPALEIGGGGIMAGYIGPNMIPPSEIHDNAGHFMHFSAYTTVGVASYRGGIIRPDEAFNIDTKIDDGRPGRGGVLAHYNPNHPDVVGTRCVDSFSSKDANYNLTFTNNGCRLYFKFD